MARISNTSLITDLREVITTHCDVRSGPANESVRLTEAVARMAQQRAVCLELLKRWMTDDPQGTLYFDTQDVLEMAGVTLPETEAQPA